MGNRMMSVLAQFSPDQEIYSIDECFLGLDGFGHLDLVDYGQEIRQRVKQWVGIPVCVGIAETKTLALQGIRLSRFYLNEFQQDCARKPQAW